jgi:putative ABC transport system substrate-binding protein
MRRREFITLLGGAAVPWPLAARAQQPAMPVIGFLGATTAPGYAAQLVAFRHGLNEAGFGEGRNVVIEYRWAENHYDRLPELAADLVRHRVAAIAAAGPAATLAAMAATTTIPVVFDGALDPVEAGFVASLNRPGGNLTGITTLNVEVGPKRLELLHELVPTATTIGLLVNPTNRNLAAALSRDLQAAARTLGIELRVLHASTEHDFDSVFESLAGLRAGGLVIGTDGFFISRSEHLGALTVQHAVPAISQYRAFAGAGGLMSYGGSITDSYRLAGVYAGRILNGEKPADLPVQQATKLELIVNLKTAKALGVTVPLALIARADEVIE